MTASHRAQRPGHFDLPQVSTLVMPPDVPPISALFLIDFDIKAGYTVTWKQSLFGLEIEGSVEYKSLPSGLHNVEEDLIYFVHEGDHAGLSAFINTKTDEAAARNARMIAVGVLLPLTFGRLGRAWRHAETLRELARELALDTEKTEILEQYWQEHGARDNKTPQPLNDTPLSSPAISFKFDRIRRRHTRNRSASDGTALIPPGYSLSAFHPARSLLRLLDAFGPAIFPVHRTALLRKRILISTHAPVHEACNFVYDISILSNIPLPVLDVLDPSAPTQRLKPLFTVGVHDIPSLLEFKSAFKDAASIDDDDGTAIDDSIDAAWIACTTDSILSTKDGLCDMLITLPPPRSSDAIEKVWPTIECPRGTPVKATQRDLRRFRSLHAGLLRLMDQSAAAASTTPRGSGSAHLRFTSNTPDVRPLSSSRPGNGSSFEPVTSSADVGDLEKGVESTTWAALAYNGFMWWASAGEQRRGEEAEEQARDASLLTELAPSTPAMTGQPNASSSGFFGLQDRSLADSAFSLADQRANNSVNEAADSNGKDALTEFAIIAYFHRLSTQMLTVLADTVDSADDDDLLDADVTTTTDEDEYSGEATRLIRPEIARAAELGGWIRISSNELARMGLDVWSKVDAEFVTELAARYFERRAYVEGRGIEVCGLRIC